MLKRISILLLAVVSLPGYAQEISASVKTVSNAAPGKDFTVEVTINKPGLTGFMKYFQELPANYSAVDVDSKGGNFNFADNGAKIIWISLPGTDQFTISYKVNVPAGATGSLPVGGKFSYMVGNDRKTFEVEPQNVTIGNGGSANPAPPVKTETPVVKETPAAASPDPAPAVTETQNPAPVAETRKTTETTPPAEPKKETPALIPPSSRAPVSAAATSTAGRTYKVQVGAFIQKPHLEGVTEPSSVQLDNGMTKYFSGNFKTYEEAVKRKKEMLEKGFEGAFIVAFENGQIVK